MVVVEVVGGAVVVAVIAITMIMVIMTKASTCTLRPLTPKDCQGAVEELSRSCRGAVDELSTSCRGAVDIL